MISVMRLVAISLAPGEANSDESPLTSSEWAASPSTTAGVSVRWPSCDKGRRGGEAKDEAQRQGEGGQLLHCVESPDGRWVERPAAGRWPRRG